LKDRILTYFVMVIGTLALTIRSPGLFLQGRHIESSFASHNPLPFVWLLTTVVAAGLTSFSTRGA